MYTLEGSFPYCIPGLFKQYYLKYLSLTYNYSTCLKDEQSSKATKNV